ncbi:PTS sugar transporter [Bacillus sp. FJAT-27916]|uniref:PTS sugar transporter subunit IIA n=1 Tax=Bacillus sp. FJAT-27916 TaxID=1679169 RepID=UPI0006712FBE|nr:PTS glucose transporter subunit IIA [Bacillus sp. FJAT-27916]KMY42848.1 PTS sugar transporter [Bacillus sp. FJAT-27916]
MFKSLFKKKQPNDQDPMLVPLKGKVVDLETVPDPVFAQKMMGDGFAIDPADDTILSPVDGEVITIFPTKHAISLKSNKGREILIHVGLETVQLNGDGFTPLVMDGQKIKKRQELMKVDFEAIKPRVPSILTPVIFTNLDENEKVVVEGENMFIKNL